MSTLRNLWGCFCQAKASDLKHSMTPPNAVSHAPSRLESRSSTANGNQPVRPPTAGNTPSPAEVQATIPVFVLHSPSTKSGRNSPIRSSTQTPPSTTKASHSRSQQIRAPLRRGQTPAGHRLLEHGDVRLRHALRRKRLRTLQLRQHHRRPTPVLDRAMKQRNPRSAAELHKVQEIRGHHARSSRVRATARHAQLSSICQQSYRVARRASSHADLSLDRSGALRMRQCCQAASNQSELER